ncbi:MAG TPA: hypothetical protein VFW19_05395 [Allosphingosinicella sp.]|nr:hypothetical protein [Allosphingosinicella sp.]
MLSLSNKRALRLFLAFLLLAGASTAMADILILRADGPSARSFPPGKRLPDSARIMLRAKDELIVLDSHGTRTLRGPGTFIAGMAPSAPARFAARPAAGGRRAPIGAARGVGTGPRPPTLWNVDVSKSGNVCVLRADTIALWRPDPAAGATLVVTGAGRTRRLAWPAGAATLGWPRDLPLTGGTRYRLSRPGAAVPTAIRFRTLRRRPVGPEATAAMLIANGCSAQLDLLIDMLRVPG